MKSRIILLAGLTLMLVMLSVAYIATPALAHSKEVCDGSKQMLAEKGEDCECTCDCDCENYYRYRGNR